jgi:hypothetical protein
MTPLPIIHCACVVIFSHCYHSDLDYYCNIVAFVIPIIRDITINFHTQAILENNFTDFCEMWYGRYAIGA